jgi:hypothetical protein
MDRLAGDPSVARQSAQRSLVDILGLTPQAMNCRRFAAVEI